MDKEQQFVGIVQECSDFVFSSVINGVVSSKISTKSCNNCLSSKRGQCENEFKNNLENSK
ncbi:Uncharacterised protein [Sarcina ventriculi]|uniref:hypothetical protein n=1 Tax=Sarcina ventriculi TaxID=1267 RepID=UPI000D91012E|nr:hypothetical protein [Sarcina ventriculi]SPZ51085.1 Uncharacterised protein [Sarcina ventriculi]